MQHPNEAWKPAVSCGPEYTGEFTQSKLGGKLLHALDTLGKLIPLLDKQFDLRKVWKFQILSLCVEAYPTFFFLINYKFGRWPNISPKQEVITVKCTLFKSVTEFQRFSAAADLFLTKTAQ